MSSRALDVARGEYPHSDTRVERAAQAMERHAARMLRAMYAAIYSYRDSGDVEELCRFADSARMAALVRSSSDYDEISVARPRRPRGRGRALDEIFSSYIGGSADRGSEEGGER